MIQINHLKYIYFFIIKKGRQPSADLLFFKFKTNRKFLLSYSKHSTQRIEKVSDAYRCSRRGLHNPSIVRMNKTQAVEGSQVTVHLFLETTESSHLSAQTHAVLKHHCTGLNTQIFYCQLNDQFLAESLKYPCTISFTFPIVVTIDMKSIQKLIKVVSHEVHSSCARLNNADHLKNTKHKKYNGLLKIQVIMKYVVSATLAASSR